MDLIDEARFSDKNVGDIRSRDVEDFPDPERNIRKREVSDLPIPERHLWKREVSDLPNSENLSISQVLTRKKRCGGGGGGGGDDDDVRRARRARRARKSRKVTRVRVIEGGNVEIHESGESRRSRRNRKRNERRRRNRNKNQNQQQISEDQEEEVVTTRKVIQNGQVISESSSHTHNGQPVVFGGGTQAQTIQTIPSVSLVATAA